MTVERSPSLTAPTTLEDPVRAHPERFRVLTGDRPTGPLHLGHLFGTLANRVRLQRAGVEVFVVIADYQVITDRDGVGDIACAVRELVLDYLAAGIDPRQATVFAHSAVPALNQLVVPLLSLVTVAELGRNPTVKAEAGARTGSARHLRLIVRSRRRPRSRGSRSGGRTSRGRRARRSCNSTAGRCRCRR